MQATSKGLLPVVNWIRFPRLPAFWERTGKKQDAHPANAPGHTERLVPQVRMLYFAQDVQTSLERLSHLPNADQHLKPGLTLPALLQQANEMTGNEAARALQRARSTLFKDINRRSNQAT